ncbi:unnamed protein product, partial [marine sediment metagenome]
CRIRPSFSILNEYATDGSTLPFEQALFPKKGTKRFPLLDAYRDIVTSKHMSESYAQFRSAGLEFTGIIGMDRIAHMSMIGQLAANTKSRRALNIVSHPLDALRMILGKVEVAPRLAEFKAAMRNFEEAVKAGDMDGKARAIEAVRVASDVTVNFRRMGTYGKWMNQYYAFFNAAIQGSMVMGRKLGPALVNDMPALRRMFPESVRESIPHSRRRQARKMVLRAMTHITAPTMALWWMQKDEDWYRKLPPWDKYGFIHIPLWETDIGDPTILRIPFPFEL